MGFYGKHRKRVIGESTNKAGQARRGEEDGWWVGWEGV